MASKEIVTTPAGWRLVGNLDWRLLPAAGRPGAALRSAAADRSASHAVIAKALCPETVQVGKKTKEVLRSSAGFSFSSDDDAKRVKEHSLAAAFARWVKDHGEALLYLRSGEGGVAVVVVINGMPVLDKVVANENEAFSIAAGYIRDHEHMSVFANDLERFPSSLMHEGLLDALIGVCGKETLIRVVPPDFVRMAIVALLILGAVLGYLHYKRVQAEQARREALLRAQAEDPVTLYQQGLAQVATRAGVQAVALAKAFESAMRIPTRVQGWNLTKVACAMELPCTASFARTDGTFSELKVDVPHLKLVAQQNTKLDEAVMTWEQPLPLAGVGDLQGLGLLDEFVLGAGGSQLQRWLVAGLSVQLQVPQLWPQVQGVPSNFKHPQAFASGAIDVGGVTLPFAQEVLTKAPGNVIWTGWQMEVGEAKQDALARVKVRISGNFYVRQN